MISISGAPITAGALRDRLDGRVLIAYGLLGKDLLAVVIEPRRSRITALGPLREVRGCAAVRREGTERWQWDTTRLAHLAASVRHA